MEVKLLFLLKVLVLFLSDKPWVTVLRFQENCLSPSLPTNRKRFAPWFLILDFENDLSEALAPEVWSKKALFLMGNGSEFKAFV